MEQIVAKYYLRRWSFGADTRSMTYLSLVWLALLATATVIAAVFAFPFDSAFKALGFLGGIIAVNLTGGILVSILRRKLNRDSFWLKSAANNVGVILVNIVVAVLLLGIGGLVFLVLKFHTQTTAMLGGFLFAVFSFTGGRYFQKRLPRYPMLAYGISFFFGFLVLLAVLFISSR